MHRKLHLRRSFFSARNVYPTWLPRGHFILARTRTSCAMTSATDSRTDGDSNNVVAGNDEARSGPCPAQRSDPAPETPLMVFGTAGSTAATIAAPSTPIGAGLRFEQPRQQPAATVHILITIPNDTEGLVLHFTPGSTLSAYVDTSFVSDGAGDRSRYWRDDWWRWGNRGWHTDDWWWHTGWRTRPYGHLRGW